MKLKFVGLKCNGEDEGDNGIWEYGGIWVYGVYGNSGMMEN